jgi:hypothetical protein
MRKSPKIRDIKPEQINIGDLISVTEHDGELTTTRTGKVAGRQHSSQQTHFYTKDGKILMTWFRDGLQKPRIRLIYRDDSINWLPGMDI